MAALDFPANPTNGQTYDNYQYDSSVGVWRSAGTKAGLTPRITALEAASPRTVASSAARDALFPTPTPGNSVWRSDTEQTERYYAAKGSPTRSAGWYSGQDGGLVPIIPTSVTVGSGSATVTGNGKITLSACSTFRIDNIFSSTYNNYKILYSLTSTTAGGLYSRFSVGGSPDSTAIYIYGGVYGLSSSSTGPWAGVNQNNFQPSQISTIDSANGDITVYKPFESSRTVFSTLAFGDNGTSNYSNFMSGIYNATKSFDGIYFYPGSGNMSGTIQVYGYRN